MARKLPVAIAPPAVMRFGPGKAYAEFGARKEGQPGLISAGTASGWLWLELDVSRKGYVPDSKGHVSGVSVIHS